MWSLRNLGFVADPYNTATLNSAPADPLVNYDLVFNTGNWPSAAFPAAQSRLTAFFASGGGYIGAGLGGANFLTAGAQITGLIAEARGGSGRSGIVTWTNFGDSDSVVTGAYPPDEDTAIMDPPTWFSAVPGTMSVDARLPLTGFFLSGLWNQAEQAGGGRGCDRARDEHRPDRADHILRDEPAVPRRSRASGRCSGRLRTGSTSSEAS